VFAKVSNVCLSVLVTYGAQVFFPGGGTVRCWMSRRVDASFANRGHEKSGVRFSTADKG